MKSILCRMALPLIAFGIIATSCNTTNDLSNKTSITVNCIRTNPNPNEPLLGTEVILTRHEGGERLTRFAMVPSTLQFDDVEPGMYTLEGQNSNSEEKLTLQVDPNEEEQAELRFAE